MAASRRRLGRVTAELCWAQRAGASASSDEHRQFELLEAELEAISEADEGSGNGSGAARASRTGAPLFGPVHRQLLLYDGAVRERVLNEWRRRHARLCKAMYPHAMGHSRAEMPCLWTPDEWRAAEAQNRTEPILNKNEFEAQMAAQEGSYTRDGYLILRNVMTPEATSQFIRSMQRCQELNDRLLRCDWNKGIDWAGLGWSSTTLPRPLSRESILRATGGAQMLSPQEEANGVKLLRQQCVLPEYFPPAHDGFLMRCFFHNELLDLHRRCLGTEQIYCASSYSRVHARTYVIHARKSCPSVCVCLSSCLSHSRLLDPPTMRLQMTMRRAITSHRVMLVDLGTCMELERLGQDGLVSSATTLAHVPTSKNTPHSRVSISCLSTLPGCRRLKAEISILSGALICLGMSKAYARHLEKQARMNWQQAG